MSRECIASIERPAGNGCGRGDVIKLASRPAEIHSRLVRLVDAAEQPIRRRPAQETNTRMSAPTLKLVPLFLLAASHTLAQGTSPDPQVGAAHQEAASRSEEEDSQSSHPAEHHPASGSPSAFYGSYPMSREFSGASWQPDSTPMRGRHFHGAGFDMMLHGFIDAGWQDETGPRGDGDSFSTSMLMLNGNRPLGPGRLGLRFMGSIEPSMCRSGYPVLFQTGETFDGVNPLIDRQHPHDVIMELAATYSFPVGDDQSVFVYLAPVGEPAIGRARS